jgi:SAM-dependent methyltransferase
MATVPIRPRVEHAPGPPLRWIRSITRRLLASAGARAALPLAPGDPLTDRVEKQQVDGRPGPPSAGLREVRAAVAALMEDIERLRSGLALHRSLDLEGGSGVRAQVLCERFAECDALCATPDEACAAESANRHPGRCRYLHSAGRQELSFPDETFDFVHCGTLRSYGEDGERVIAEVLRVLRLHGVAVVDLPAKRPSRLAPDDPFGAVRLLVQFPVLESARSPAGGTHQITVTVTNSGARVLGSALVLPRLEIRWRQPGGAPGVACEAVLDGILLPGDSRLATLPVTAPSTSGVHVLELSLLEGGPWGEGGLVSTALAVAVGASAEGELGGTMTPALPAVDQRVCTAVTRADGVMLGARTLGSRTDLEPGMRYFFARA